jgi:prepilin peptidase CpaA
MPTFVKILLLTLVVVAGIYDLRFRKIPNWLNLSGVVLGLGVNTLLLAGHGFAMALLGLGCSLAVYVPLYLIRGMGAGDVKLMAAVGAMAGPRDWLIIFLVTALLGGVVSILFIAWKKRFHQTSLNLAVIVGELSHGRMPSDRDARLDVRDSRALRLPHGTLIATGAIAFLVLSTAR